MRLAFTAAFAAALLAAVSCWAEEAAPAPAPALPSVFARLAAGDGALWAMLVCAFGGLAFGAERMANLSRQRHAGSAFEKSLLHWVETRGLEETIRLCGQQEFSLARVVYAALVRHDGARSEMEAAARDECRRLLYDLRRNARWIAALALLAAGLGLLGGAAEFRERVAGAGAEAPASWALLLSSVASALLLPALGLGVAILLGLLGLLVRWRAADIVREIEERALDAVVAVERSRRQPPRPLEDVEEHLETRPLPRADQGGLDAAFEDGPQDERVKTNVTTTAQPSLADSAKRLETAKRAAPPGAAPSGAAVSGTTPPGTTPSGAPPTAEPARPAAPPAPSPERPTP